MARRHSQRPIEKRPPQCKACSLGFCAECVDVIRILTGAYQTSGPACGCRNDGHDGEPRDQQVKDPFTGDIHGPGMIAKEDGTVLFSD
jgi:hypothetical protein